MIFKLFVVFAFKPFMQTRPGVGEHQCPERGPLLSPGHPEGRPGRGQGGGSPNPNAVSVLAVVSLSPSALLSPVHSPVKNDEGE